MSYETAEIMCEYFFNIYFYISRYDYNKTWKRNLFGLKEFSAFLNFQFMTLFYI